MYTGHTWYGARLRGMARDQDPVVSCHDNAIVCGSMEKQRAAAFAWPDIATGQRQKGQLTRSAEDSISVVPAPIPPLPADTANAAKSVFNIENLYLVIGEQIDRLLDDVNWEDLNAFGTDPANTLFVLAMVTIFQFAEELPDRQAADAVRTRMDWKYALHLSLDHPGFDAAALSEFRQRLLRDSAGQRVFQRLLDHLRKIGLLGARDKTGTDVVELLTTLDTLSQVEKVTDAMRLTLETLASYQPDWLRTVSLPHWYDRYDQELVARYQSSSREEQEALVRAVGADITYLLEAIAALDAPDFAALPEVQALRHVWPQGFKSCGKEEG